MIAVCEHANVPYELVLVDTLAKANTEDWYKEINPTCTVPMLVQGQNRVVAGGQHLFDWVVRTSENAERAFGHADQDKAINALLSYFFKIVRKNTSQQIGRLAIKVLQPDR